MSGDLGGTVDAIPLPPAQPTQPINTGPIYDPAYTPMGGGMNNGRFPNGPMGGMNNGRFPQKPGGGFNPNFNPAGTDAGPRPFIGNPQPAMTQQAYNPNQYMQNMQNMMAGQPQGLPPGAVYGAPMNPPQVMPMNPMMQPTQGSNMFGALGQPQKGIAGIGQGWNPNKQ